MTAAHPRDETPERAPLQDRDDRSLSTLVSELFNEATTLLRKGVELARAEMSEKVSQATNGASSLAVGGAIAYAGLLFLLLALTLVLSRWMADWLAALIVGAVVVVIGLILLAVGRRKLRAGRLVPERTLATLQDDSQWARQRLRR